MQNDNKTRWTVTVSKDTDIALRSFLAQRGLKKGDISKFVEDAVKWRVLDETIAEARSKFSDLSQDDLQALVDEASLAVRDDMRKELAEAIKKER